MQRRTCDMIDMRCRWIADACVGATLRCDHEIKGPTGGLDGNADLDRLPVCFDVLFKRGIVFHMTSGYPRCAEGRGAIFDGESEALAIKIVAVGNFEANINLAGRFACTEAKGNRRIQKIVRARGTGQTGRKAASGKKEQDEPRNGSEAAYMSRSIHE
jgi:hypothetical protein